MEENPSSGVTVEAESAAPTGQPAAPVTGGSRVCAIKFRDAGRTYDYDMGSLDLKRGDLVLVDFSETRVVGIVSRARSLTQTLSSNHPKIIRKLDEQDKPKLESIAQQEERAFKFALQKLRARNLPAKMVAAELSFNEDRLVFYVASEERIDLRNWIRDVSVEFRARIDVRQIGARDAAKFIGGVGSCGRELCCSTWLVDFRPVSIKMAKDQNLALNPDKVSGQCGRLLCCLTYEQDTYRDMRKGLPKIGKRVYTPMGDGRVKDVNVLRRKVRVQLLEGYEELDADQVSPMFGTKGELLQPSFGPGRTVVDEEDEDGEEAVADGAAPPAAAGTPAPAQARPSSPPPPPRGDRPQFDRPRGDRPQGDRGPRPQGDRPRDDRGPRPQGDRPPRDDRGPRPQGDRPPRGDRPQGDRPPRGDRPQGDRGPRPDRPPRGDRPPFDPNRAPRGDRPPQQQQQQGPRPQGPPPDGAPGAPEGGGGPEGSAREDGGRRRRRRRGRGGRGGGGGGGGPGGPEGGGAPPSGGGGPPPSAG